MKTYFDRYRKVKYRLLEKQPFFAEILLFLEFGLAKCETCYTDMKHLVFDPEFIDQVDDLEFEMLIMHEILHCVLHHCYRSRTKITPLYNMACDIVVNSYIVDFYHKDTIAHHQMMYVHKGKEGKYYTAEEIYYDLLKDHPKNPAPSLDNHQEWLTIQEDESDFHHHLENALQSFGNHLPTHLRKLLNQTKMPQIDWRLLLRQYVKRLLSHEDYSFSKRDHRFFDRDYILPGLCELDEDMQLQNILIAVDVSGSIDDHLYTLFVNEIMNLKKQYHFEGWITFFNTKASEPKKLSHKEDFDFGNIKGYGGTRVDEVFDRAKDLKSGSVIVFTDGEFLLPEKPSVPILWVLSQHIDIPFGESVFLS